VRDLSKAKRVLAWHPKLGVALLIKYIGKRDAVYYGFIHRFPDNKPYYRDLRDMRMNQLTEAARMIGDYLTEGKIEQRPAEEILDLIYAELNRRLTK
jgi:hypothetical protein